MADRPLPDLNGSMQRGRSFLPIWGAFLGSRPMAMVAIFGGEDERGSGRMGGAS